MSGLVTDQGLARLNSVNPSQFWRLPGGAIKSSLPTKTSIYRYNECKFSK